MGVIEVSRAELQENVHHLIQCIYGLKCRDLPMPLPLDAEYQWLAFKLIPTLYRSIDENIF